MSSRLEQWAAAIGPKLSISLGVSFYVDPVHGAEPLVSLHEEFCARWGDRLRWFVEDDSGKPRAATAEVLAYPRRRLAKPRKRPSNVHWAAYGGAGERQTSAWNSRGVLRFVEIAGQLGCHALHLSMDPLDAACTPEVLLSSVLAWSRRASILHGYAGYFFEQGAWSSNTAVALASRRFQTVEVEDTSSTSMLAHQGLKSTNWLTIVSDELLRRVGGRATLGNLSTDVVVHDALDGVVLQLGPDPRVGDVNREEDLSLYRQVARVLKPLRTPRPYGLGGFEDQAATASWLARFD